MISDKYLHMSGSELNALSDLLLTRKLSGTNEVVAQYERDLACFFGSRYAIATSSGTAAIQVALTTLGVQAGDEVVVPPTCPVMSVFPILALGARPVFCDTERLGFGLDTEDLVRVISSRTRAILEVPMWGYPISLDQTRAIAKEWRIPLVVDMAQAHGTRLNGHHLSQFADMACFSTHDRKILATGEGGFVLTDEPQHAQAAQAYIQFGNMTGETFGLNFKLSALQACIGRERIGQVLEQIAIRTRNAKYIIANLSSTSVREIPVPVHGTPNYYSLVLELNVPNVRAALTTLEKGGVPSDVLRYGCTPLYKQAVLRDYARDCPNAEATLARITTVPVHPGVVTEELDLIVKCLNALE